MKITISTCNFLNFLPDFVCWLSDDNLVADGILDVAFDVLNTDTRIGMVSLKVKDVTGSHIDAPYLGAIWESGILNCNQGLLCIPTGINKSILIL